MTTSTAGARARIQSTAGARITVTVTAKTRFRIFNESKAKPPAA